MMETNYMSSSKFVLGMMFVLSSCMGMAPVWCPQRLVDRGRAHALNNASLFDGPPSEMADLIPVTIGGRDVWDLDRIDPYLVCRYSNTAKTVTFHTDGAKSCAMLGIPFRAYCK